MKNINFTKTAFIVAKEAAPQLNKEFNIEEYVEKLDGITSDIAYQINGKSPKEIIDSLIKYIFYTEDFEGRIDGNFLLNEVLDKKSGNCVGISTLFIALGEMLDLPIYGCLTPRHMFVRWDDGKTRINIDPSIDCPRLYELSDSYYIKEYNIPETGIYLRNLSKKEVIGCILNSRGMAFLNIGELERALSDLDKAIEMNPKFPEAFNNRGIIYLRKDEVDKAIEDFTKAIEMNPNSPETYYNRGRAYLKIGEMDKVWLDADKGYNLEREIK